MPPSPEPDFGTGTSVSPSPVPMVTPVAAQPEQGVLVTVSKHCTTELPW